MLKIYKYLKPFEWVLVVVIVGITILQVWGSVMVADYTGRMTNTLTALASGNAETRDVWYNGGMMLLFAAVNALAMVANSFLAGWISSGLSMRLRTMMFNKVESFSFAEINSYSIPSLITRSTNDVQQVQMANIIILRMLIQAPITAIWAITKIGSASWELTVTAVVAVVLLVVLVTVIFVVVLPKFKIVQKLVDRLNGVTRDTLSGVRVVRAYNAQDYEEAKFETANQNMTKTQLFTGRVSGLMNPAMMLIMNGGMLAIYWLGAWLISKGDSSLDAGSLVTFAQYTMQIIMAFMMLMMMFLLLPRAQVSATRINTVLATPSSINDPETEAETTEEGTVEFRNVSFRYPDADGNSIDNISFKAKKGDTVAFIGSTGSGKTTLINLVPRFYDATDGEVLVDGVNVRDLTQKTLRDKIGYVPQRGYLFSGTVSENIGYGDKATQDEIVQAAEIAEADGFIRELPDGYENHIAQGGTNVSGGQRQRLCIARAVATHPEIMIFDDSFSALDYRTDKKVRDNLKESMKDTTCLIVAQRIGTIMDADKIIVLDQGKAVGVGTHKELLDNCDVYREIALSQLSEEELGICRG